MGGYIHSGVAGKMDKIRNAHPGAILVSDKFGNAEESINLMDFGNSLESEISEIGNDIGILSNLTTTNKNNLVAAINELVTRVTALEPVS